MIQKTTNYSQFKILEGNRKLFDSHLAKLSSSILKKNLLEQHPIIVNAGMEVIDGQHRLEVAKNNKLEIYYIIVEGASMDEVILLNSNNKSWNGRDFINSYAARGKEDYLWLSDFMEQYSLSITQAVSFIFGYESSWSSNYIKNGSLQLTQEQKQKAQERADILWELRPFMKRGGVVPRGFLVELLHLFDEGKAKTLVANVKKRGVPFYPETQRKEAYNQLRKLLI